MEWQVILAIILIVPVALFPAALIWFTNISGIFTVMKETRQRELARKRRARAIQ